MANTTFTDGSTVIVSSWLNDVNNVTYNLLGNGTSAPTTQAQLVSNLGPSLSATYLTQSSAASTYLTQTNAVATYLTQASASSTYLTQTSAASNYLTQSSAASTYLTQTNAASTYVTQGANSTITSLSGLTTALSIAQGGTGAATAHAALNNLNSLVNLTSANSDYTLAIGETAYVTYSGQGTVPLHVAVNSAANQIYELTIINAPVTNTFVSPTYLWPNNTNYTNMFWAISSTVSSGSVNAAQNSFYLCAYDVMCIKATVSVASGAQYVSSSGLSMYGTVGSNATGISEGQVVSWWLNTASTTFTNNSTTAWTSLGTLINSYSVFTGITLIKRIA